MKRHLLASFAALLVMTGAAFAQTTSSQTTTSSTSVAPPAIVPATVVPPPNGTLSTDTEPAYDRYQRQRDQFDQNDLRQRERCRQQ